MSLPCNVCGLPLDHGVSPTQTTFCFLWINFTITKYATPLQNSIKHFCLFLWFFLLWFFFHLIFLGFFLFLLFWGFVLFFSQLTVFPFVKVVLFAMHPNTSYMSLIHNNFDIVNDFLYKCVFVFFSLLFSWFSSKLLFSLYYFYML